MGLGYTATLDMPYGVLLDLIAIGQVKSGAAELQRSEEDDFFALLSRR